MKGLSLDPWASRGGDKSLCGKVIPTLFFFCLFFDVFNPQTLTEEVCVCFFCINQ